MKKRISFLRSVTRQSKRDENDHNICISNISKPKEVNEEQGSILVEMEEDETSSTIDYFDHKTVEIWKLQDNSTIESWERRRLVLDKGILIYYHVNAKIGDDKNQDVYNSNTASSPSIFDSLFCFYDLFSVTKDEETNTEYDINQPRGVIDIINSNVKLQKLHRNYYASQPTPYLFDISSFKQNWVVCFDSLDDLNSWYDVCSCFANRNHSSKKSPVLPPPEQEVSLESVNNVNLESNQYEQLTTDRNNIASQINDSFRQKKSLYEKMTSTFRLNRKSSNNGCHNSSTGTDVIKNPNGEQTVIESYEHNHYNSIPNNEESKSKGDCISKPPAGATTVQIRDPTEVNEEYVSSVKWCAAPVSTVDVRGENYIGDGKKIPCPYTLYELIHVDVFNSVVPMQQMAARVELPNLSFEDSNSPKTWQAPDLFISSLSLPTTSTPGEGYVLTGYYRMREQTRKILRFITSPEYKGEEGYDQLKSEFQNDNLGVIINGVKLWENWCRDAPVDQELQKRMKFIARGDNLREIGVPRWICNYNGKPMLIKRPGVTNFVHTYPELSVIEFDLNLHAFPTLFKRAMSHLLENYFPKMLMTFCYIIEGRNNDELPEVLIGNGLQLCFLEPLHVIDARDVFSGRNIR